MFRVNLSGVIPEVISGILVAAILGAFATGKKKFRKTRFYSPSSLKEIDKLQKLIDEGNDSLKGPEARFKRKFARDYYHTLTEWPKGLSAKDKHLLTNFIKSNRTHIYSSLNDSISIMVATLNGYKSQLIKKGK